MSPERTAETARTAEKIVFRALCVLGVFFFVGMAACSSQKPALAWPRKSMWRLFTTVCPQVL